MRRLIASDVPPYMLPHDSHLEAGRAHGLVPGRLLGTVRGGSDACCLHRRSIFIEPWYG